MDRSRLVLLASLLVFPGRSMAQEIGRPDVAIASDSVVLHNTGSIMLDRNLNTLNWLGRAYVDTSAAGVRLSFHEQYLATVVQLESDPGKRNTSNQQQSTLSLTAPSTGTLAGAMRWDSFVYTDSRDVGLSRVSMHDVLGGFQYSPFDPLTISPYAGYRWDNQSGFRDAGPSVELDALLHPIDADGYLVDARGQYHEDHLNPRLLQNDYLRAGLQKSFSSQTRDSLEMGIYHYRREFYSPDSSIESRQEDIFQIANLLSYAVDPSMMLSAFFSVSSRTVDRNLLYQPELRPLNAFNTSVDEFRFDTYAEGTWRSDDGRARVSARFGYSERDELHHLVLTDGQTAGPLSSAQAQEEESKNNLARRTMMSGRVDVPLSFSDQLFVSASASLLRYDTPSASNVEDRDELLVVTSVGTTHRFSGSFEVGITVDGTLGHLVYLLADRSANNNINRVLRLTPRTLFRPTWWFSTQNSFEVLANYTVYDFEQEGDAIRSFAYRQFGWADSTSFEISHRVGLDFVGYLRLYERGQLRWSEFKELTENSYVDRQLMVQARYSPDPSFEAAVGVKYFAQLRYAYGAEGKVLDTYFRSLGPTCAIAWQPGPHSRILMRGWYENRRSVDGALRGLVTMNFTLLLTL